ncbi:MAG TPA: hypothetical protein V6D03_08235, partial [Candidatus Caenarcaniphilales bacterium]
GGTGKDHLTGNEGNDLLQGEAGIDILSGELGNDNLYGGADDDHLSGDEGHDQLVGEAGHDVLLGGAGNDVLIGVAPQSFGGEGPDPNAPIPGLGEVDKLSGGTGKNKFILGDATQAYYNDGNSATSGTGDYALIVDFRTAEDVIELTGTADNYLLREAPSGLPAGTALSLNKPNGEPDELIAIVQGATDLSLGSSYFNFVS